MSIVLDPTAEVRPEPRERLVRPKTLLGLTVGLLDISKPRDDVFLNRIEHKLKALDVNVKRFIKPTFTKLAPTDLRQEIAQSCDAVIEALAD